LPPATEIQASSVGIEVRVEFLEEQRIHGGDSFVMVEMLWVLPRPGGGKGNVFLSSWR
jgi:hypothetical protein